MWTTYLEQVRREIAETSEETRVYFESSYQRYLDTLKFLGRVPPGRILDIGCSPGHMARAFVLAGFDLCGIDFHPGYPERYLPEPWRDCLKIQFVDLEKNDLPYEADTFDYVTCCEVLEHIAIRHPVEILNEAYRVLRPQGVLLLSTPQVANLSQVLALCEGRNVFWEERLFYGSLDRHNREPTFQEVKALMEKSLFEQVECRLSVCDHNWNSATYELTTHLLAKYRNKAHPVPPALQEQVRWAERLVDIYLKKEGLKTFDPSLPFFNNTVLVKASKRPR